MRNGGLERLAFAGMKGGAGLTDLAHAHSIPTPLDSAPRPSQRLRRQFYPAFRWIEGLPRAAPSSPPAQGYLAKNEDAHIMTTTGKDTLGTRDTLNVGGKAYAYYSLKKAAAKLGDVSRLPFSMKVLLENLLRNEDNDTVGPEDLKAIGHWNMAVEYTLVAAMTPMFSA